MENLANFISDEWMLCIALVMIIGLLVHSWFGPRLSGIKQIGVQDAVRLINQDDTVVLDIRLEKEYSQGHILNSVHIPLGALDSRIREIEKHKENPILVSCQTGNRSHQANRVLKKRGFTNLHNLTGGINAWMNANLPITKN